MVLTVWKIEEEEHQLRPFLSLNASEQKELESITAPQSRLRWMASRLALKSVFDEWKIIDTQKDRHGKPYFELLDGHFSLSHSGEYAVCIYHPMNTVGIDIEFMRSKIFNIQHKFMKEGELDSLCKDNTKQALFVSWCAKEAVYKWQGEKGLSMKDNISILPFQFKDKGQVQVELIKGDRLQTLEVYYERLDNYMMAYLCTK